MTTVTWKDLFGFDYGAGMPEPVDLRLKRQLIQAQIVGAMLGPLGEAEGWGAPAATGPAEAWGRGAVTPHNVGAAVDIRYHTKDDSTRAFANGLLELFIRHRGALGWGFIAYNRMNFGQERLKEAATDGEHLDHIHIDWVDYSASRRSTARQSFQFIDENGIKKTKSVDAGGQWISMNWNASAALATLPSAFLADFRVLCTNAKINETRHAAFTASDFGAAYHGADMEADLTWLRGWWSVWDSNQYYYFFGPKGFIQYTKAKPANKTEPLKVPLNQGVYTVTRAGVLFVDWNPADGGATRETFTNARVGRTTLHGTSNRYAPLVATRIT